MRVAHGGAGVTEEPEPVVDAEALLVGPDGDRLAVDIFHDDIGRAVVQLAAVEQAGDVGVGEVGEDLPLAAEARDKGIGEHAGADDLDGDLVGEVAGIACPLEDGAHAALSDQAGDAVGADAFRGGRLGCVGPCAARFQGHVARAVSVEQLQRAVAQGGVVARLLSDPVAPRVGRLVQRLREEGHGQRVEIRRAHCHVPTCVTSQRRVLPIAARDATVRANSEKMQPV